MSSQREKEEEDLALIEDLRKKINQQNMDIQRLKDELSKKKELSDELKESKKDNSRKEKEIEQLKEQVSKAIKVAFSEDVLHRLAAEVLDELKASNPEKQEILLLAKQRFSENESVTDGWFKLSDESNELVKKTVNDFQIRPIYYPDTTKTDRFI